MVNDNFDVVVRPRSGRSCSRCTVWHWAVHVPGRRVPIDSGITMGAVFRAYAAARSAVNRLHNLGAAGLGDGEAQ